MTNKKQVKKSNVQRVRSVKTKAPTARKNTATKKKQCSTKKPTNTKPKSVALPKDYVIATPSGVIIAECHFDSLKY